MGVPGVEQTCAWLATVDFPGGSVYDLHITGGERRFFFSLNHSHNHRRLQSEELNFMKVFRLCNDLSAGQDLLLPQSCRLLHLPSKPRPGIPDMVVWHVRLADILIYVVKTYLYLPMKVI